MTRIIILVMLLGISGATWAQEEEKKTGWDAGAILSLNTSHTSLTNWVAGGQNTFSLNTIANGKLNYLTENYYWNNNLDIGYGVIRQGAKSFIKSDDKIEFNSVFGKSFSKKWSFSGLLNFKSQMAKGYSTPENETLISDLLSPAYLMASAGFNYKPIDGLSVYFGPLTGKMTFMNNPDLVAAGGFGLDPGQHSRVELGGYIRASYEGEIIKNVTLQNKLDLFSNYLNNPQYVDINWEVLLLLKVNKFISASINTHLIYDHDIDIGKDTTGDGVADDFAPRVQFKEIVGLGLTITI